jgi:hypothetical protein
MTFKEALVLLAGYSSNLQYKIQGATQDNVREKKKERLTATEKERVRVREFTISSYQTFLTNSLVYYYVLLHLTKVTPAWLDAELPTPFRESIPWLQRQMASWHIHPVNTAAVPGIKLLQEEPYSKQVNQHLENLEQYSWLTNSTQKIYNLILPESDVPNQNNKTLIRTRPVSTTLTPCRFRLLAGDGKPPKCKPHWLGTADNISLEAPPVSLLWPPEPQTLGDLSKRLVQYCRGLEVAIAAMSGSSLHKNELLSHRLECEISYSLLLEYFAEGLFKETEPVSSFLLYDSLVAKFDSLRRMGISRVIKEGEGHVPAEKSNDYGLCRNLLPLVKQLRDDARAQFELVTAKKDDALSKKYSDFAGVTVVLIDRLEKKLRAEPSSDNNAANHSAIADLRL